MPADPANRRPIARVFRATAHRATRWCTRVGIQPNWISYASMAASSIAAVAFACSGTHLGMLLLGCAACVVRLWCNMLDGMVAIEGGTTSRQGEIVNELPDRISDVLIFVGVALNSTCSIHAGYASAIAALLVAYVGIIGQTVGTPRQFGGWMSKPWRMVVVMLAALLTGIVGNEVLISVVGQDVSWLTLGCWVVVAGAVQTVVVRLRRIMQWLAENPDR